MKRLNPSGRLRPLARTAEVLLFWFPVFVPLVLLAQLGTKGLRPALGESERLGTVEADLDEKYVRAMERQLELEAGIEALSDPIYRERIARRRRQEAEQAIEAIFEPASTPARRH